MSTEESLFVGIRVFLIGHHHRSIKFGTLAARRVDILPVSAGILSCIEELIWPTWDDAATHEVPIVAINVATAIFSSLVACKASDAQAVGIIGGFPCGFD
jgi:hypothetical protein